MDQINFSVLLAVYNGEKYLKKAIESVLNQTYTNLELLIGLNGCVDNSLEVAKSIKDDRIKIFDYGMDKGKSKTINKLLNESTGNWIAFQDHDDIWVNTKLEDQLALTKYYNIIGTQLSYIDENDKFIQDWPLAESPDDIYYLSVMLGQNQIANTSAIVKKTCFVEAGGLDESIIGIEDYDLWLKLMTKYNHKAINIENYDLLHRIHKGSNFNTNQYNIEELLKKYNPNIN